MDATLKQRAYDHIRQRMVAGQLPPGERLSNRMLAKEIGVSLIPVREAISQLVSEGLAEHRPRMGAFVTQLSREDLAELYDFREALECHAITQAIQRLGEAELAEMERCNERMREIAAAVAEQQDAHWSAEQVDRWMMADAGFHMTLLRAAGNRRVLKTVAELRVMTHIFGHSWRSRPVVDLLHVCRQHDQVLDALRRGDVLRAVAMMQEHLRHGCGDSLRHFDQQRMQDAVHETPQIIQADDLRQRLLEMEARSSEE